MGVITEGKNRNNDDEELATEAEFVEGTSQDGEGSVKRKVSLEKSKLSQEKCKLSQEKKHVVVSKSSTGEKDGQSSTAVDQEEVAGTEEEKTTHEVETSETLEPNLDEELDEEWAEEDMLEAAAPDLAPEESYGDLPTAVCTVVDPKIAGSSGDGLGTSSRSGGDDKESNSRTMGEDKKSKSSLKDLLGNRSFQIGLVLLLLLVIVVVVLGVVLSRAKEGNSTTGATEPTMSPATARPTSLADLFAVPTSMELTAGPEVELFAVSDAVEKQLSTAFSTLPGFVEIQLVLAQAAGQLQSTLLFFDGTTYFEDKVDVDQLSNAMASGVCVLLNDGDNTTQTSFSRALIAVETLSYELLPGSNCSELQQVEPSPTGAPSLDFTPFPTIDPNVVYTLGPTEATLSASPSLELQRFPETDHVALNLMFGDSPESVGFQIRSLVNGVYTSLASHPVGTFSYPRFRQRSVELFISTPDLLGQMFEFTIFDESPAHDGYSSYTLQYTSPSSFAPPCVYFDDLTHLGLFGATIELYRTVVAVDSFGCLDNVPIEELIPENPPYIEFTISLADQPEGVGLILEAIDTANRDSKTLYERPVDGYGFFSPEERGTNFTVYFPYEASSDGSKFISLSILDEVTAGACCPGCFCETAYDGFQLAYVTNQDSTQPPSPFFVDFMPGATPIQYEGTFLVSPDGVVQPFVLTPAPTATPVGPYISIQIRMDRFPEEVGWKFFERVDLLSDTALQASLGYNEPSVTITEFVFLDTTGNSQDYMFELTDSRGDGIIDGTYTLAYTDENNVETIIVTSDAAYQFVETIDFTISGGGEVVNVTKHRDTFFFMAQIDLHGYPGNVSWVFAEVNQIGTELRGVVDSAPVGTYGADFYQYEVADVRVPYTIRPGGQYFAFVVSDATEIDFTDCDLNCVGGFEGFTSGNGIDRRCFNAISFPVGITKQASTAFFVDQNGTSTCSAVELSEELLQQLAA